METLDIEKQSIVLLTSYFKKPGKDDVNPLTPSEWKVFAGWLKERGYSPGSLLSEDGPNIIESWKDNKITRERLIGLLKRGAQMSMVLEKWSRAGIWILTRSDADYPKKLKTRLGTLSPPILYGSGNKKLLNMEGIAVVGSRSVNDEELKYSKELGKSISENNLVLISGGAKGVDETAMLGALESKGNAIGVLADSLFQKSISQIYREFLSGGSLAFISPYYPDAGFNVGNAMGRNKYIYCLSEAAIVVHSGLKGGTWSGAVENLKKKWVPLYVRESNDTESGNLSLIKSGGIVIKNQTETDQLVSDIIGGGKIFVEAYKIATVHEPQIALEKEKMEPSESIMQNKTEISFADKSFYELFLIELVHLLKDKELNLKKLKDGMDLNTTQLNSWLEKAEADGVIVKLSKPVRYKLRPGNKSQPDLFD